MNFQKKMKNKSVTKLFIASLKKYFGPEGELFKKRQELVKPIQDEILKAIKEIAVEGSYAVIFDSSTGGNILFANPKFDISDQVLEKLGYKN